MATPRSVRVINKWPYPNAKYNLGTKIHEIIEFTREVYDALSASGTILDLVNELRTKLDLTMVLANELRTDLNTAGALFVLLTELYDRLNTGGDYQVLISSLRSQQIAGGRLADIMIDIHDRCQNQCLTDPAWAEDAAPLDIENVAAVDAIVDGVYIANAVAINTLVQPATPAWDTGVGETRLVTLSCDGGGTVTTTVGALDIVIPPRPPAGECPIGIVHIPASFTAQTTQIAAGGVTFTDGFPRRLTVYAPIVDPDVAAIAAVTPAALTAPAGVAMVVAALTATDLDKVDSLPDRG